ncbi:MAG: hypothetical protein WA936_09035 [Erythrobacter sp.]|uniref:hypothetical protein n=1 Tax=Erythrobacter sp. TaxID=1042 RepID=UPI003C73CF53
MSAPPLPLWKAAAQDALFSEPSDCSARATKFERQIVRRNVIEYAAGALVAAFFGVFAVFAFTEGDWLIGCAALLLVAGTGMIVRNLHRRASNLERRPEDACIVHLRRQYEHQHRALRTVPRWYIGPLLPGVALFYGAIGWRVADAVGWGEALQGLMGPAAVTFGIFAVIIFANIVAARQLARRIRALDNLV